jgi:hypothetical protein
MFVSLCLSTMRHPSLLILFICFHCSISVPPYPSEPNHSLGFHDDFGSGVFSNGFNRCADTARDARCECTHPYSCIAPKVESRDISHLGEVAKEEKGLEAVMVAKSSAVKQRRQISNVLMASGTGSNALRVPVETVTEQIIHNNDQCTHFFGTNSCRFDACRKVGGYCVIMIRGGTETCEHARLLDNGTIVKSMRVRGCAGSECRMYPGPKTFEDTSCLMTSSTSGSCNLDYAQRCYNVGARCKAIQNTNQMSRCTKASGEGEDLSNVWQNEVCQGCECARRGADGRNELRSHRTGSGRHGWNNHWLSIYAGFTSATSSSPTRLELSSATGPERSREQMSPPIPMSTSNPRKKGKPRKSPDS